MNIPSGIQKWIATDLIKYKLASLKKHGQCDQHAHLISTIHNLYEGASSDKFSVKSMSLAMDWMTDLKELTALKSRVNATPSIQDKVYLSICFKHWLIKKQRVSYPDLVQLEDYDSEDCRFDFEGEEMHDKICKYLKSASDVENFIYRILIGFNKVEYTDGSKKVIKMLDTTMSRSEFYRQRDNLISRLKYVAAN